MRFSLIGCNEDALRIVQAIQADGSHSLISIHNADDYRKQLNELVPAANWSEHWESLLAAEDVDALIVANHPDRIVFEDQLRKLAQSDLPMIAVHPIGDSLFAYELEMIREEAGGLILGFYPHLGHPAIERLALLIQQGDSSEIGETQQIIIERRLASRDRKSVMRVLTQDITLQRKLLGQISSIHAIGAQAGDASLSNLAVHVTGTSEIVGRWSVIPAADDCPMTITLVGSRGTAVVTARESNQLWLMSVGGTESKSEPFNDGADVIDTLSRFASIPNAPSTWESFCHDLDAAEQIERSLRRKRTIELRRGAQNEEGNFKGIMAAGGCLLLMLAFFVLIALAIFEGFRMPMIDAGATGEPAPRSHVLLRLWPVYPLAAFLLLQLLIVVTKKSK